MKYEELSSLLQGKYLSITPELIEKLKIYASLLKEWNEKINLTSITEEEEVIEKHFFDSLLPCLDLDFSSSQIADMGTGAGFPGLVIALAYPTSKVTLIDSTAKKFKFLEAVVNATGAKNVIFKVGRVEDMKKERERFDIVTCRGFSSLSTIVEVGSPLVKMGGTLVAMKSSKATEEMHLAGKAISIMGLKLSNIVRRDLPCGDNRTNIFFKKIEHTQRKYPRTWAEITNHPL